MLTSMIQRGRSCLQRLLTGEGFVDEVRKVFFRFYGIADPVEVKLDWSSSGCGYKVCSFTPPLSFTTCEKI